MVPMGSVVGLRCLSYGKKAQERFREIEDQLKRGVYIPEKRIPTFKEVTKDWISKPLNRARGKHHIHSNPTGSFKSERNIERICPPHKT